ncbi:MAG TPA: penicillin-binding protein 2 [Candidatus Binatia bacterium]|nr:penicillin-binding protein 2 [Candidatus Binatia bacterium]
MTSNVRNPIRLGLFLGGLALATIVIVARLTQVQIVQGNVFAAAARANQVRRIAVAAPRGLILDRHEVVIARSRPSFVCALIPSEVKDVEKTLNELSAILGIDRDVLRQRTFHHRGADYANFDQLAAAEPFGPIILANDLTTAQMARLAEALNDLPGIDMEEQPVRNYPYKTAASHVFGYVGAITEDEYRSLRSQGYSPNDVIGKDGLESEYDQYLRGKYGGEQIEVNSQGAPVRRLGYVDPTPGNSLVLTIDWRLQMIAERALSDQINVVSKARGRRVAGAVVVLDPNTGGVLALASNPNFDPNDFSTGIKLATYERYLHNPLQPLYDRAIGAATPTGSTFKMVTGTAAISSGAIKPHQVLYDSGSYYCHGVTFTDLAAGGLGSVSFIPALAASSDGYFYQVADRVGHERLRYYALQFGLAEKSGIDLPGEFEGNWPTNEWMMKVYHLPLEPSDVCILGIGQGAMEATPLQMANVTATIANGGTLYRPRLIAAVRAPNGKIIKRFDPQIIREVPVTREAVKEVQAGMALATSPGGTAYGLAITGLPFSGKTGTVETDGGKGPNTTWFVAYAPTKNTQMAMAVFMERTGGYGASVAAPIAQRIMAEYFHKKI